MGRKKTPKTIEQPDAETLEHIRSLGLATVEDYRRWCAENGFSKRLNKHWKVRCRERFHARGAAADQRLRQKRRERRDLSLVIGEICNGMLTESDITQPHLQRLCESIRVKTGLQCERHIDRAALLKLVSHLQNCRAKFFDGSPVIAEYGHLPGNTFVEALALVATHSHSWLRRVPDWKPRSHSPRRQFASLLRHLFVRYDDMPPFFDRVWFAARDKPSGRHRQLYIHVGSGQNIRHCRLPISFTKKMAHHFMQAPPEATIEQALRWGQIRGLGGDERLARAVFDTRLCRSFKHDDFWITVLRWFIAHPLLDRVHVGPILDYLHHQRFVPQQDLHARFRGDEAVPAQPNLSMKGRSPEVLLRSVNAWHRALEIDNRCTSRQWKPSGIRDFELLEGSESGSNLRCWTIRELLSSKALFAEGRKLKHCVATYASSCAHGDCSIWSLEVETIEGRTKAITVEVHNRTRLICQARGKANRLPNEKERNILRRWAAVAELGVASYI